MTVGIRLRGVGRTYALPNGSIRAVDGLSLTVDPGAFVTVVGRSGCGKTTLLRLVSGLEEPTEGAVEFLRDGRRVERGDAGVGIVFQEPRLMPWLTVAQNVRFALEGRSDREQIERKTSETLRMLGLERFRDAYPQQLSGGMAQRVALGRTLVFDPEIVLMDEPFGALDYFTRRKLRRFIRTLHAQTGKTFVLVTHDVDEALTLGRTVIVLEAGRIADIVPVPFETAVESDDPVFIPLRRRILRAITGEDSFAPDISHYQEAGVNASH